MRSHHPMHSQRGSALLTAVIVVTVVMVLAVGIVRFASREVAGATALRQEQALVACAGAGQRLIASKFNLFGDPLTIEALNVPLGTTSGGGSTLVVGGHYDQPTASAADLEQVKISQVVPVNPDGLATGPTDITNTIGTNQLGGTAYRVVVRCQDGTIDGGRQLEVEFALRYGL